MPATRRLDPVQPAPSPTRSPSRDPIIGVPHERRCRPRPGPRPGRQGQGHRSRRARGDARAGDPDRRQEASSACSARSRPSTTRRSARVDLFQICVIVEAIDPRQRGPRDHHVRRAAATASRPSRATSCCSRSSTARRRREGREQDEQVRRHPRAQDPSKRFGRIAAQTAKQVIIQRVREAERENVYNEYKDRKGELISGIVRRFERGNIIVDLGRAEAVLPVREQVPRESLPRRRPHHRLRGGRRQERARAADRPVAHAQGPAREAVRAWRCRRSTRRSCASRPRPASRARAPKIAVASRDRDVDPVGACVGMKGSRVQAVVQELRGEKIDIVPYDEDPARFVCNALAPAEVSPRGHRRRAPTPWRSSSPTTSSRWPSARRARTCAWPSQLTGWRIDIHSESKVRELEEHAQAVDGRDGRRQRGAGARRCSSWAGARPPTWPPRKLEELPGVPGVGGEAGAARHQRAAAAGRAGEASGARGAEARRRAAPRPRRRQTLPLRRLPRPAAAVEITRRASYDDRSRPADASTDSSTRTCDRLPPARTSEPDDMVRLDARSGGKIAGARSREDAGVRGLVGSTREIAWRWRCSTGSPACLQAAGSTCRRTRRICVGN